MNKIYIAGPMSGYPEFNFPAFNKAESILKCAYEVFNPAKKDLEQDLDKEAYAQGDKDLAQKTGFDFREAYLWDVARVIESNAIYMLPGWQYSPGASGEHAVAVAMKHHFPSYEILYSE